MDEFYAVGVTVNVENLPRTGADAEAVIMEFKEGLVEKLEQIDEAGMWDDDEVKENPDVYLSILVNGLANLAANLYATTFSIPQSPNEFHVFNGDANFYEDWTDGIILLAKAVEVIPELRSRTGIIGGGIIL